MNCSSYLLKSRHVADLCIWARQWNVVVITVSTLTSLTIAMILRVYELVSMLPHYAILESCCNESIPSKGGRRGLCDVFSLQKTYN